MERSSWVFIRLLGLSQDPGRARWTYCPKVGGHDGQMRRVGSYYPIPRQACLVRKGRIGGSGKGGGPAVRGTRSRVEGDKGTEWGPAVNVLLSYLGRCDPLFSLRENAIAKEPGLSYLERWRCVSRLGAPMV